ncbi:carbon monoxide dehydrogenase [Cryobacterium sp. TMT1-62]|uniref:SRPBCC family protein n=1 Tax=unclassified Cryobacterium TaxID=2649013 RepID=UPI001069B7CC|nr:MULTISPECIES: SRPBCC family protein [unclassified Cryobacterium]TFC40301.1 carbon monoxide dehydrogenase [Cryobacterium sp. TMT2-14]TFD31889.1 carbon monoxide dehydrogenase [Cryobacterium sp. TMT1-62]
MHINSTFSVVAPIDEVWKTLMDFERVAGCVPGAQVLNKLSDDAYQVGMKVKLGPVTIQYRSQMTVLERDATAHRAVFEGRAQETRGQGTAQGTATLTLVEAEGETQGTVSAEVALSGKVAATGRSIIGSVTDQMMALFAENLQAMVTGPAPEPAVPAAGATTGKTAETVSGTGTATAPPAAPPARPLITTAPTSRAPQPPAETSLNALDLAKGIVVDQLSSLPRLLGVIAAVAFVAYWIGRRAGGR